VVTSLGSASRDCCSSEDADVAHTLWTAVSTYADEVPIPATALGAVTVGTTAAKTITIGATGGTPNASNTLTLHGFKIWSDNI
jgi:hypothetical protein